MVIKSIDSFLDKLYFNFKYDHQKSLISMINHASIEAIQKTSGALGVPSFHQPLYESYCFSKIPGTLMNLLGIPASTLPQTCWSSKTYDRVILFLIDGFGWQFLEKNQEHYPFLKRFFTQGTVSKLTSQFPSTTAAHITTLCTGLEVGQTGIIEWFYHEPSLNRIIAPLLFSYAGDGHSETLTSSILPHQIFPEASLFGHLKENGISSSIFLNNNIGHSTYSKWMFRFSKVFSYENLSQCLNVLKDENSQKGLFYIYYGDIDSCSHRYGMDSAQTQKAIQYCFSCLEDFFQSYLVHQEKTALILTADHGMTSISPDHTFYLNQEIPELKTLLKKGADGNLLTPAGSCRSYFIHALDHLIGTVYDLLSSRLSQIAKVVLTEQLINQGFFGKNRVLDSLIKRTGNLTILPFSHNCVWWHEKGRYEQNFHAMHGGLTAEELETIFLFQSLN